MKVHISRHHKDMIISDQVQDQMTTTAVPSSYDVSLMATGNPNHEQYPSPPWMDFSRVESYEDQFTLQQNLSKFRKPRGQRLLPL
jgi:hypothetical protein